VAPQVEEGWGAPVACEPMASPGESVSGGQPGVAYEEVAERMRGVATSICGVGAREWGFSGEPLAGDYRLSGYPIVPSLRVAVDGALLPRSRAEGWDYRTSDNAIDFHGVTLTHESTISVAYLMWEPAER